MDTPFPTREPDVRVEVFPTDFKPDPRMVLSISEQSVLWTLLRLKERGFRFNTALGKQYSPRDIIPPWRQTPTENCSVIYEQWHEPQ